MALSVAQSMAFLVGCHRDEGCTVAESDLRILCAAIERFASDHDGKLPATIEHLFSARDVNGQAYLEVDRPPRDPWKRPYRYCRSDEKGSFCLFSLGRDGVSGGAGEDADLIIARP